MGKGEGQGKAAVIGVRLARRGGGYRGGGWGRPLTQDATRRVWGRRAKPAAGPGLPPRAPRRTSLPPWRPWAGRAHPGPSVRLSVGPAPTRGRPGLLRVLMLPVRASAAAAAAAA